MIGYLLAIGQRWRCPWCVAESLFFIIKFFYSTSYVNVFNAAKPANQRFGRATYRYEVTSRRSSAVRQTIWAVERVLLIGRRVMTRCPFWLIHKVVASEMHADSESREIRCE